MTESKFLEEFEIWMVDRGQKRRRGGAPVMPLSPITARLYLNTIKSVLRGLGYLSQDNTWNDGKRIQYLSLKELDEYLRQKFADRELTAAYRASYVKAIRKFAEFLTYEKKFRGKPMFSEEKLFTLRDRLFVPAPEKVELEIIEPKKVDGFLDWLEGQHIVYFTSLYLMRWLGLRYSEARNAPADLFGSKRLGRFTIRIDRDRKRCYIWGKGMGGLNKPRNLPVRSVIIQKLDKYMKWREGQGITSEYLFVTCKKRFDQPLSIRSGNFNRNLLPYARRYGKFTEEELGRIKSHSIGRHCFGTFYAPGVPAKTLMDYMGIEDYEVYQRYVNYSDKEQVSQFEKAHRTLVNGEGAAGPAQSAESANGELLKILQGIREELGAIRKERDDLKAQLAVLQGS